MSMHNPLAALVVARAFTGDGRPRCSPVDCEPHAPAPEPLEDAARVREVRGLAWLRMLRHARARTI